jgi:aldehyde dehydrogenase (NAD+)
MPDANRLAFFASRVAIKVMLDDLQAPFGGFKHSGVGREFGRYGIEGSSSSRGWLAGIF